MKDIRCDKKLHAVFNEEELWIEIRCHSRFCGYRAGVVVVHRFSTLSWELIDTRVFRDPDMKGNEDGTSSRTPVRLA